MQGFLRSDGRKGIRNVVAVAYLVECSHHVAARDRLPFRERGAHLIGFPGCYPNAYAARIMRAAWHASERRGRAPGLAGLRKFRSPTLGRGDPRVGPAGGNAGHPGVAAARRARSSRPRLGPACAGRARATRRGRPWASTSWSWARSAAARTPPAGSPPIRPPAGPSTCSSTHGATCIFEETGELIGCEQFMAGRAATPAARPARSSPAWPRPPATTAPWAMAASPRATRRAG